jgi:signal transduction histidine kinase
MRRRIAWLVAATTSAVVLAFVIPLGLLVAQLAQDRALAGASTEAQQVAVFVAGVDDPAQLERIVNLVNQGSPRSTGVLLADRTTTIGDPVPAADDPAMARALAGTTHTDLGDGAQVYVPVVGPNGTAVVRTAIAEADLRAGTVPAWLTLGLLGALMLVAAVVAADRMGRWVSTPVANLADVAHRLREGDMTARATLDGPDEVVELARALNRFADRIDELVVAERESVADLSHRLRTPMTALRLDLDGVTEREAADRLRVHVDHLGRTVDAIVKDARRPVSVSVERRCDAATLVRERVGFWSALAADQGRRVDGEIARPPLLASIEAEDLRDIVDVLVDNVFAHTPEGTAFRVDLFRHADGTAELVVADEGPGPPSSDVTERGRSGAGSSGLGLDIARRAAMAAGGGLVIRPASRGGTEVVVTLAPAGR